MFATKLLVGIVNAGWSIYAQLRAFWQDLPSPDWTITPTALLAAVSALIALAAFYSTRFLARRKATLDLIEKTESTDHYRALNQAFSRLRLGPGFLHLNNPAPEDVGDRQAVKDYLNHYELVAIGIRRKVLDEGFYKTWMLAAFVRDWNAAAGWVQRERWRLEEDGRWTYYDRIFANYEYIARRWSRQAVRLSRRWSDPPSAEQAGGPGDEPLPVSGGEPVDTGAFDNTAPRN